MTAVKTSQTQQEPISLDILAHQGWQSGTTPSNSLSALRNAFGYATSAELDVYIMPTAQGKQEIVVMHPEAYFLYADPKGMRNEQPIPMSFEDLRAVQVDGQQLVPTLDEVLDEYHARCTASGYWTDLHIELKGPQCVEAVIEKLHARIAAGKLSYDNFLLTGLSYATDSEPARIEQARKLDPNVRLVMVLRGDNLPAEGYEDWNAVFRKAKELNVEVITLARKFATSELIETIRAEGFNPGVYHARTSDELENVIELGATVIAADMYQGPKLEAYPNVREYGSPFFQELDDLGWFKTRNWIWEIAWDLEKKIISHEFPEVQLPEVSAQAALVQEGDSIKCKAFARQNSGKSANIEISDLRVDPKFLNNLDHTSGSYREAANYSVASLISRKSLEQDFVDLCVGIAESRVCCDDYFVQAISKLDLTTINKLSKQEPVSGELAEFSAEQLKIVSEAAYQTAWRAGRLVGMLAFSALNPRHQTGNDFVCKVETAATAELELARTACIEQVSAQALRSGKRVTVQF